MPIRILIADDHGLLRAGIRALLNSEPNMELVGEAQNGDEALRLTTELRPDILLLDINMPGPNGIEVTRRVKSLLTTRVLILTMHEDAGLLRAAMQAGASGYIIKRAVESELLNAIHVVSEGNLYVHPVMTRALVENLNPTAKSDPVEPLTAREIDVLRLLVRGYSNRQIADELKIGVRTVDSHRANLKAKLGLESRVELVRYAMEHNLLK